MILSHLVNKIKSWDLVGKLTRPRTVILTGASILASYFLVYTDPTGGAITKAFAIGVITCFIAVLLAHIARKGILDYKSADMSALFEKARQSSTGSGLALIAIAIILSGLFGLFGSAVNAGELPTKEATLESQMVYNRTTCGFVRPGVVPPGATSPVCHGDPLPPRAREHLGTVLAQRVALWPSHPYPALMGGLIEHESCASKAKCWNPTSQLKTQREEGAGLGQLTRAYHPGGKLRFDALAEMRAQHPTLLGELSWDNIYQRPDLQIRAMVLKNRDNYSRLEKNVDEPLSFADAAYNGGLGGVNKDIRACGLKPGCNPRIWFQNVEYTCTKSRSPIYGGRSACDINRHHVNDVWMRSDKYVGKL